MKEISSMPEKQTEVIECDEKDVTNKINDFISEKGLNKKTVWRNDEFLNFYFSLKRPFASAIVDFLENVEEGDLQIPQESLDLFKDLDRDIYDVEISKIKKEKDLILQAFNESDQMSSEKKNEYILKKFKLEEKFKGTEPYFIINGNIVLALLDFDEYNKVSPGTCGHFATDQEVPVVCIKIYKNFQEISEEKFFDTDYSTDLDLKEMYHEINQEVTNKLASGEADEIQLECFYEGVDDFPDEYEPYLYGKKNIDNAKKSLYEELHDDLADVLNNCYPYKAWYANNILKLDEGGSWAYLFKEIGDYQNAIEDIDVFIIQKDLQETLIHEMQHTINRFLPVSRMRSFVNEDNLTPEICSDEWLSAFADEVTAFSFEGKEAPEDSYLKLYQEHSDLNGDDLKKATEIFMNKVKFLNSVNFQIMNSVKYREVAALFSLEDKRAWKFLHKYLMKGNFPDLGYGAGNHNEMLYGFEDEDEWDDDEDQVLEEKSI